MEAHLDTTQNHILYLTRNMLIERKPARIQLDPDLLDGEELPPQTGTVFNIWFNKWSGGNNNFQLIKSKYKLNVERDTGYTKADKKETQQFFCLFFAKGMCCKGKKCQYLHRIPTDEDIFPLTVDCFGREKFSDYKDDMSGIGSFNNVNTTLYISGLVIKDDTHDLLDSEFRKFGKIKRIYILNGKNCGFVTFKNETSAQFAKEAMTAQSLYGTDILNIKWAREDPNPTVIREKKRQLEIDTQDVVRGLLEKFESKKLKSDDTDGAEPVIEEPIETTKIPETQEIKQIEAEPKNSTMFNSDSLKMLKLLRKKKKLKIESNAK